MEFKMDIYNNPKKRSKLHQAHEYLCRNIIKIKTNPGLFTII